MSYFMMRPCKTTAAYFATLRKNLTLDLEEAGETLRGRGYRITDCGVLLIIHDDPERTLYRTGRVLVKVAEEGVARRAVEELYDLLGIVEKLAA
ncbi:MAG: hypothetical protein ACE5HJ_06420 [Thermoplasmata archaeon]